MKVYLKPRPTHPWRNGNRETEKKQAEKVVELARKGFRMNDVINKKQKLTLFISSHVARLIKADCVFTGARVSRLTESLYKKYLFDNGKAEDLYRDVRESLNTD